MIQDVVLSFILSVLREVCPIWTSFTSLQFSWHAFVTIYTCCEFLACFSTCFGFGHLAIGPLTCAFHEKQYILVITNI